MDRIDAMRVFCAVVDSGGFVTAAERLGVSTSAASRLVAQLESHLNVRLLHRTTRRVKPTEAGEAYFERCRQWLVDLEETEAVISGEAHQPRGRLRLTAPTSLAINRLGDAFVAFSRRYPAVELDLALSDYTVTFEEEGVDLAIRVGQVGSDTLVARRIGQARLLLAASPDYLRQHGLPQSPHDLVEHQALMYTFSSTGGVWTLQDGGGQSHRIKVRGALSSNNGLMLAQLAAAGGGITAAPDFLLAPWLQEGSLVEVLPEWNRTVLPIQAVYPTRRYLSARVQAMIGFLVEWFGQ